MLGNLRGKGAVLTGPTTPLSAAVARRLGNEGAYLVFTGPDPGDDKNIRSLMAQFRHRAGVIEADLSEPDGVARAIERAERLVGQVDLVIHTLGSPEPEERGYALVIRNSTAPLRAALTCTRGAMDYMRGRREAQILHLVSASQIGAMEVEKVALSRLQQAWGPQMSSPVSLSAIYFDESASLPPFSEKQRDARILESFTGRLLEEDGWADRVLLEREIGDMVVGVCCGTVSGQPEGPVRAFGFHPGSRRLTDSDQDMMVAMMA